MQMVFGLRFELEITDVLRLVLVNVSHLSVGGSKCAFSSTEGARFVQ
jgi:hypothetical protein